MPRKAEVSRRETKPDAVFGSTIITQFINAIMMGGKKTVAEGIMYGALQDIQERTGRNPVEVLQEAISNVMPQLEVRARRVGGATYQIPKEVCGQQGLRTLPLVVTICTAKVTLSRYECRCGCANQGRFGKNQKHRFGRPY